MNKQSSSPNKSTKLTKALSWMGGILQDQPERQRHEVIQEAAFRFDLTPTECEFLRQQFTSPDPG